MRPDITDGKQIYTAHTFDLTADPVEIVYGVEDLTIAQRKEGLIGQAISEFRLAANEQTQLEIDGDGMDIDTLVAAKITKDTKLTAINACTTHDDLDALAE